jgi:DNA-binding response OmpR family regulator
MLARRILMIEDRRGAAKQLAKLMTERGHHVVRAEGGSKAISLAHETNPDLVLLDLSSASGPAVEAAKTVSWIHGTPVGLVSALPSKDLGPLLKSLPSTRFVVPKSLPEQSTLNVIDRTSR